MNAFYNTSESLVTEMIDGLLTHASVAKLKTAGGGQVLIRKDWSLDNGKVAVLSGGGAGHEPAHAGYIGAGMLTGAIIGELFASPSVGAVEKAIDATCGEAGCLLIIKNYTGDRLNFGLAAERARARGLKVETVLVSDDVALPGVAQPRGLAGTVLIHKIAGYHAEQGKSLQQVAEAARNAAQQLRTLGISLSAAQMPGKELPESDPAIGLGIHNETGAHKVSITGAKDAVSQVLDSLDADNSIDSWVMLINDLGGCSPQERAVITNEVINQFGRERIDYLIGPAVVMSALNMHGFSLTLLPSDESTLQALEAPTSSPDWPSAGRLHAPCLWELPASDEDYQQQGESRHDAQRESIIHAIATRLIEAQVTLDELDAYSGDADAGSTFAAGSRALIKAIDNGELPSAEDTALCDKVATLLEYSMGGSSGILLSMMFTAAATELGKGSGWAESLTKGIEKMQFYGGAQRGDRTMLDALIPAIESLAKGESLADAAKQAQQGAEETASMLAKAGRAAQVPEESQRGNVDPGAQAIALIFDAAAAKLAE